MPDSSRKVANGHKDASVLVVESDGSEEPVVRPKVTQESPRSHEKPAKGKSGVLPACTELQACMAAWSVPQKQRNIIVMGQRDPDTCSEL